MIIGRSNNCPTSNKPCSDNICHLERIGKDLITPIKANTIDHNVTMSTLTATVLLAPLSQN